MRIFEEFFKPEQGAAMILRAGHILVGIAWIGLLYFFNFVQVPAFAAMEPGPRSEALRKLTFRALWWFRWAAMATFLFGIALLGIYTSDTPKGADNYLATPRGTAILTGMLFGITMFANVWSVIWPQQKINIASAEAVAAGGQADPRQPDAAKKAARASRANTFFSIPMLWFMVFAPHFAVFYEEAGPLKNKGLYFVIVLVLWAFVELSALGLIGGLDNPFNKAVFDDHKTTIIYAFVYWAVIFFIGWEVILRNT